MEIFKLNDKEREEIAIILSRRANEIAGYKSEHSGEAYPPKENAMPASVEYALELEITRLRKLEQKIRPPKKDEEE